MVSFKQQPGQTFKLTFHTSSRRLPGRADCSRSAPSSATAPFRIPRAPVLSAREHPRRVRAPRHVAWSDASRHCGDRHCVTPLREHPHGNTTAREPQHHCHPSPQVLASAWRGSATTRRPRGASAAPCCPPRSPSRPFFARTTRAPSQGAHTQSHPSKGDQLRWLLSFHLAACHLPSVARGRTRGVADGPDDACVLVCVCVPSSSPLYSRVCAALRPIANGVLVRSWRRRSHTQHGPPPRPAPHARARFCQYPHASPPVALAATAAVFATPPPQLPGQPAQGDVDGDAGAPDGGHDGAYDLGADGIVAAGLAAPGVHTGQHTHTCARACVLATLAYLAAWSLRRSPTSATRARLARTVTMRQG